MMKKINLLALCFLAATIFSCSKDEEKKLDQEIDPTGVNELEDVALDVNKVSEAISIEGAIERQGSPVPTGNISFSLDYSEQSAFQTNGFDINFKAPSDFAGAYVQIKDENGMADSYFDVPASATNPNTNKKADTYNRGLFTSKMKTAKTGEDTSIDVNFGASVTAGTFCYVICVYDSQGNISAPSEVCVTVESWGGNTNLTATWNATKWVGNGATLNIGESYCETDDWTINCVNEQIINVEIEYCDTVDSFEMILNGDGTYTTTSINSDTFIDYDASSERCEVVVEEDNYSYISKGNWAYNEEKMTLTLVEFEYTYIEDGETETGQELEGYLLFDGEVTITASTLVIEESDGSETYEYYFDKK